MVPVALPEHPASGLPVVLQGALPAYWRRQAQPAGQADRDEPARRASYLLRPSPHRQLAAQASAEQAQPARQRPRWRYFSVLLREPGGLVVPAVCATVRWLHPAVCDRPEQPSQPALIQAEPVPARAWLPPAQRQARRRVPGSHWARLFWTSLCSPGGGPPLPISFHATRRPAFRPV